MLDLDAILADVDGYERDWGETQYALSKHCRALVAEVQRMRGELILIRGSSTHREAVRIAREALRALRQDLEGKSEAKP